MKSLAVRVTLLCLFLVAVGAGAYVLWMDETRASASAQTERDFEQRVLDAGRMALDLRSAQQGYVAIGQGDPFWIEKVGADLPRLREALTALRAESTAPAAQSAIDEAQAALQDFEQMDRRAREYAGAGQKLLASDLIFGDGMERTAAIAGALDQARMAERDAHQRALASLRRRQLATTGGVGGAAILLILLLLPVQAARIEVPVAQPERARPAEGSGDLSLGAVLDEEWSRPVRQARQGAPTPAAVELATVASLCTELARVADTPSFPALLERAAAVLDAAGIVLWISDPDARELSPIVTYGYPPQLVARLGTIPRDAENATAAAFRTSLLQTVKADAVSNGAVAAPLVTPAGCVGVMAAELRNDAERDASKLAIATIIAAQLATLVGPPSARAQKIEATS